MMLVRKGTITSAGTLYRHAGVGSHMHVHRVEDAARHPRDNMSCAAACAHHSADAQERLRLWFHEHVRRIEVAQSLRAAFDAVALRPL